MLRVRIPLLAAILLVPSFAFALGGPEPILPEPNPFPPRGGGNVDPWLDARGDALAGDLHVGTNALVFRSSSLASPAPGRLAFNGATVCTQSTSCYAAGNGLQLIGSTFSLAPDGVGANEIAAGAVGPDELATGAVGADEISTAAVGLDELTVPISTAQGNNDGILLSPFASPTIFGNMTVTPAADAKCMVAVEAWITSSAANSGLNAPRIRVAWQDVALAPTHYVEPGWSQPFAPLPGAGTTSLARTFVPSVSANTTYRFGANFETPSGDWVGDLAGAHVSYVCL